MLYFVLLSWTMKIRSCSRCASFNNIINSDRNRVLSGKFVQPSRPHRVCFRPTSRERLPTPLLEQYQVHDEDYCRTKTWLKWLCHSCQDQDKGIIQKNTYSMEHDERHKINQKKFQFSIWKNCRMGKYFCANPKRKTWKNTNYCRSLSSDRSFQLLQKMEAGDGSNPHVTSISAT